jgi:hypothetical protein
MKIYIRMEEVRSVIKQTKMGMKKDILQEIEQKIKMVRPRHVNG